MTPKRLIRRKTVQPTTSRTKGFSPISLSFGTIPRSSTTTDRLSSSCLTFLLALWQGSNTCPSFHFLLFSPSSSLEQ